MRQSLSELYSTVRKAAVGRGAPHGIAEDLADAVCWLNSLSFDGVSCAVDCLAHWPSDTSAVRLLRDENGLILETENTDTAASALFAGPYWVICCKPALFRILGSASRSMCRCWRWRQWPRPVRD